jgi:hypothetical protein
MLKKISWEIKMEKSNEGRDTKEGRESVVTDAM